MNIDKPFQLLTPPMFRYAVVGVTSLVADYLVFLTLYYIFDTGTAVAAPAGIILGLIVNFILNKLWSFDNQESSKKNVTKQIVLYLLLVLVNILFTYFLIETLKNAFNFEPKHIKLLASACTIMWNYTIYQKIIFKN